MAGTVSSNTSRVLRPRLAGLPEAEPMLTHGSGCQRAWSGPLGALVVFSVVKGSRRGIGPVPAAPSGNLHQARSCYQMLQRILSMGVGITEATPPSRQVRSLTSATTHVPDRPAVIGRSVHDHGAAPPSLVKKTRTPIPERMRAPTTVEASPAATGSRSVPASRLEESAYDVTFADPRRSLVSSATTSFACRSGCARRSGPAPASAE